MPLITDVMLQEGARRFSLLGDPMRLRLVRALHENGETSVQDLADVAGSTMSNVSQHLNWAQDDDGVVWHLGQYPEVYEEGAIVETPVWIHGLEDAKAGISMKPVPQPFGPSYSQGWGPAVGWTDRAKVFEMGSSTCVPASCYLDVLVIDEFNRDEPDAHQLKYYVRGVGNVRVGWAGAKEGEQEVLELVRVELLSPEAMAEVRKAVIAQDERGYTTSSAVYGLTPRVESSVPAS